MPVLVQALLTLITNAPQLIDSTKAIYDAIKHTMSPSDQATIDKALADAIASDAAATAKADAALTAAANR